MDVLRGRKIMGVQRMRLANILGLVLPSLDDVAQTKAMQETAWADGLRGIAALMVVSSHLVLCFTRVLSNPCCENDEQKVPYLFQRPVLRLIGSGHSWVAIFLILSGFVNALKPLTFIRKGQVETALNKLASSAVSRIFRLVLPAAAATTISWMLCQLGLYKHALDGKAYWIYINTPRKSLSLWKASSDLFDAIINTWIIGANNQYDQPQWALIFFLQGSLMIITALFITARMNIHWRTASLIILAFWSLNLSSLIGDPFVGFCCLLGVALAEICLSLSSQNLWRYTLILTVPIGCFGLYLMSYPPSHADATPWSANLHDFGIKYFPHDTHQALERVYASLGGLLLVIAIIISPHIRVLLSQRPLVWLGKVSFGIYLLHGILLRTVFAWGLFLGGTKSMDTEDIDTLTWTYPERYQMPGTLRRILATVIFLISLFIASHLWYTMMEPIFARITTSVENVIIDKPSEVPKLVEEKNEILPIYKD